MSQAPIQPLFAHVRPKLDRGNRGNFPLKSRKSTDHFSDFSRIRIRFELKVNHMPDGTVFAKGG